MKLNTREVKLIRGMILRSGLRRFRFRFVGRDKTNGVKYFDIYEDMSRNYKRPIRRRLSQNCLKWYFFQDFGQTDNVLIGQDKKGSLYLYKKKTFNDCVHISKSVKSWELESEAIKFRDNEEIEFNSWEEYND